MILLDDLKVDAQQALDELIDEGRLPFRLRARILRQEEDDFYVIYFHDSRIRSVSIRLSGDQSFKDLVRAAVLRKVSVIKNPSGED